MPPLLYWSARLIRRKTPQSVIDWMLERQVFLRPGKDTREPESSAERYLRAFDAAGLNPTGKTVCILGFGGSFGTALHLLECGVGHVICLDPNAPVRARLNRQLDRERLGRFLLPGNDATPDPRYVTLVRATLPAFAATHPHSCDAVVSTSVFEHVRDVELTITACAAATRPSGMNIHFIDIRDHFFHYPFEMLCYSQRTWTAWLDASNHLNRWRLPQFEQAFRRHFGDVQIADVDRLLVEFLKAKDRIRPEFLSGDDQVDAVAQFSVCARLPVVSE